MMLIKSGYVQPNSYKSKDLEGPKIQFYDLNITPYSIKN